MFCEKCGAPNDDAAKVCVACGAEVASEAAVEAAPAPAADEKNSLGSIFKIVFPIAAVLLAFIILLCAGVFTSGDKKAVKKYIKAMANGDASTYVSLSFDPYMMDALTDSDDGRYDSKKEMIEDYDEGLEDVVEGLEDKYGKNYKVKVKITDVKKYKKKDIKALNEHIADLEIEAYSDKKVLQDIRVLKVEITTKGSEDEDTEKSDLVVYKVKGKWYVGGIADLYSKSAIKEAIKEAND